MAKKKNQDLTEEVLGTNSAKGGTSAKTANVVGSKPSGTAGSKPTGVTSSKVTGMASGSDTEKTTTNAARKEATKPDLPPQGVAQMPMQTPMATAQQETPAALQNKPTSNAKLPADAQMEAVPTQKAEGLNTSADAALNTQLDKALSLQNQQDTSNNAMAQTAQNAEILASLAHTPDPTDFAQFHTVSSKKDAESALSDYHYVQSEAVSDAYAALEEYLKTAPEEYTSTYQEQIDGLLAQILNREEFSYDFDADPLYQQYKNQYQHGALLAMQDTMAQAQNATGGYGSSYATQVASGAYQQEMNQLTDAMPELYQLAYELYSQKGDAMQDNLTALATQEKQAQGLYQQGVDNYYTGLTATKDTAENAYQKEYGQYQDSLQYLQDQLGYYAGQEQQAFENNQAQLAYQLALQEYQESVRQWQAEQTMKQGQWAAEFALQQQKALSGGGSSSSGGSSSGSGSSGSGSSGGSDGEGTVEPLVISDEARDLKNKITHEMRNYEIQGATAKQISSAVLEIIDRYYQGNFITKEEANYIGKSYGINKR